ncbi:MAG: DUF1990 family protein [bacterium]|nr:DUF1990 family protein [bacterium]
MRASSLLHHRIVRRAIGVGAAALAGLGAGWLIRRYAMPITLTETAVAAVPAAPAAPDVRASPAAQPSQPITSGVGDLYHRRYQVDIADPALDKAAIMAHIFANINEFVPRELGVFERTHAQDPDTWQVGDEFLVRLTGPWNGPVRLVHLEPTLFTFITLEGHLEAGEIQFALADHPETAGALRFEIRSWARSSDRITDFFYHTLGISRFAQTRVWTYFCQHVADVSGGTVIDTIRVTTQRVPVEAPPVWKRYERQFDRWAQTALNFDPTQRERFTAQNGWRLDDYRIGLPSEPPGLPLEDGAWAAARQIVQRYEFPDPALITGIFIPDRPLEERIMILRARFLLFTFLFGVKIVGVVEETRTTEKRGDARVWGYGYRTLEGHFEMGEIMFEVWKFLTSGEVEFRIHAYSRTAAIRNPLYRVGFALFGRRLQRRFARTAMERMQQLVIARLAQAQNTPDGVTDTVPTETPEVAPVSSDPAAAAKADEIAAEREDKS